MARHQEAGYSPSTNDNVPQSGEKSSDNLEFRRKRLHRQINPKYADLLNRKEYTPTTIKELQDKAMDWIVKKGGVVPAAEAIISNNAPANTAVSELARRFIFMKYGLKKAGIVFIGDDKSNSSGSFWKMGCGEDTLFSKRCLPRRAILQRSCFGTQKKHSLGGVPLGRF